MVEVAIASVEAIFDWKAYLKDTFEYVVDDADTDNVKTDKGEWEEPIVEESGEWEDESAEENGEEAAVDAEDNPYEEAAVDAEDNPYEEAAVDAEENLYGEAAPYEGSGPYEEATPDAGNSPCAESVDISSVQQEAYTAVSNAPNEEPAVGADTQWADPTAEQGDSCEKPFVIRGVRCEEPAAVTDARWDDPDSADDDQWEESFVEHGMQYENAAKVEAVSQSGHIVEEYRPDEEEAMNAFWMEENELDGFQWMDGDLPPDTDPKQDAGQGKG